MAAKDAAADERPTVMGKPRGAQRLLLVTIYGVVLLGPLALTAGAAKLGAQGRFVVFAYAVGCAGMSMLALQVAVSGHWPTTTALFGLRRILAFHRHIGIAVVL